MTDAHQLPPDAVLMQGLFGFMVTKCLSSVAAHNIPDALKDGPMYYIDLAKATGTDQRALHRVMRMLSSAGFFNEPEPGKYALNPVSEMLRTDVPGSMHGMAVMITSDSHWLPWGRMEETLRSGNSGPQHAFGTDLFTWFQHDDNRRQWEIFNAAMTSFSGMTAHAVAATYDFRPFKRIVDIGGGHGLFLKTILESAPDTIGVLFDLPSVVEGAPAHERIERQGGDFFKAVPEGGDCYTLKHIIHDWDDEQCRIILKNIADAMDPAGRVLIVEVVMPESPAPHVAKFADVNMLAMTEGGCERTEAEFKALLESSGLKLQEIHPADEMINVIEAVKQ